MTLRVELFPLQHRVEDAEEGSGVRAATGRPLPAERVVGEIGVDQRIPEPLRAILPGDEQVLHEERGDDHAHAVMHPTGGPKLAHAGIDDGVTGVATFPCAERGRVGAPGEGFIFRTERAIGGVGEVIEQMVGELAPADFAEKRGGRVAPAAGVCGCRARFAGIHRADRVPDLARADLTKVQVRGEAGSSG